MNTKITKVHAREVIDSRGNPTIEAEVTLAGGATGRAIVPSGASTGEHEAWELRDDDKKRFGGKGVRKAVANVNEPLAKQLEGCDALDQIRVDRAMVELDGTPNKSKLGANAISGCVACERPGRRRAARIAALQISRWAERARAAGADDEHYQWRRALGCTDRFSGVHDHAERPAEFLGGIAGGCEIFHALKTVLKKRGLSTAVGDEGGFAPNFESTEDALKTIGQAVEQAGYKFGEQVFIALDVAASEFYEAKEKRYVFTKSDGSKRSAEEMVAYLGELARKFPIVSIEDGCAENDWEGWKKLTDALGEKVQLVGDDLLVTNVSFCARQSTAE
jgi:enolase